MKLAIMSDLHLGKRQYRTDEYINKYEQIGYRAWKDYINIIKNENPDLVINAGDTFDVANPPTLAISNFIQGMTELNEFKTMAILGNHDFSFINRNNHCSSVELAEHDYFADYDIKSVEIEGIQFVMMPYIYEKEENLTNYFNKCKELVKNSYCEKKILVTHGCTEYYIAHTMFTDKFIIPDEITKLFDLVIIGHIHQPFDYKQGKTLVISPGGLIDYQADKDHTGVIFLDTDTMEFHKELVKTPHIIKVKCTDRTINRVLSNVTEDIYQITFSGNIEKIDNDLFIEAKNKAVNLIIQQEENIKKEIKNNFEFDIYTWVEKNYPEYTEKFTEAKTKLNK